MESRELRSFTLLPCCGSIEPDYEAFQYFPVNVWEQGLDIISPSWLTQCYVLKPFHVVNLHLACRMGDFFYTKGIVDSTQDGVSRIHFIEEPQHTWPLNLVTMKGMKPIFQTHQPIELLYRKFFKDCLLLKKGVAVYLKHLNAYFSRIMPNSKNYAAFDTFFFDEVSKTLQNKIARLQQIENELNSEKSTISAIEVADFLELHSLLESELNLEMFNLAFRQGDHLPYLISIKELEEKLYWNYNNMLLIYDHLLRKPKPADTLKAMIKKAKANEQVSLET
ncbi:MAG: hypothetical protein Q8K75_06435 [Chlamydiales bacterium]|nr:hypothetical protein [Chlamydiales bacterium]